MTAVAPATPRLRRMGGWLAGAPFRADTWRWAAFCVTGLLVGVVALVAGFCGLLVGGLLVVTVVGIPAVLILLSGLRAVTRLERRRLARRGASVAAPYRGEEPGLPWWQRMRGRLRDPATFRDLGWLVLVGPLGVAIGLVVVLGWLTAAATITLPLWYRWLPEHHAVLLSGPHEQRFVIDSTSSALPYVAIGVALVWVSAWLTVGLGRTEVALTQPLLRGSPRLLLQGAIASRRAATSSQQRLVGSLARDLHDGAQARLVAMSLDLNLAMHAEDGSDRDQLMQQAYTSSRAALAELRDLVRGIEPPLLRERGLLGAIDGLAREAPQLVTVYTNVDEDLPPAVASSAYFIIAEALANAAKHSRAENVRIDLDMHGETLYLRITDDGQGGADATSSGLRGLAERARAAGGVLTISSPKGGPTRIEANLPCE
jgi:signal transduction histidine kinase